MKKTVSKKDRDNTAFLYLRLSRDDNLEGESYSIGNQKKLLTKAAKDMGYTSIVVYSDDGVSGVTMNRPGFNEMMAELEKATPPLSLSRICHAWGATISKSAD